MSHSYNYITINAFMCGSKFIWLNFGVGIKQRGQKLERIVSVLCGECLSAYTFNLLLHVLPLLPRFCLLSTILLPLPVVVNTIILLSPDRQFVSFC